MGALGDYDDERGRDQMDREHWAEVDRAPARHPSDTDKAYASRLQMWLWNRQQRSLR
jgi:uncharacterized protein YaeQ